ncbi:MULTISPECIES: replication/maintenance protein RepL [Burkholderia cepacia complex]|uniref:replication/maintenance protein RepL n=1 Tax=Burkholderia cepacia complex TaxID=87882 RepID=UPI001B9060DB|nr:helix-turn-helix domain-containing protein [Burkholderia vietnamiensis]MBR7998427.1 replication/maintenance protein RepL [Burkholderia vietnamiensis]
MTYKQQIVEKKTGKVKSERDLPENFGFVMLFENEISSLRQLITDNPKALALTLLLIEQMDKTNSIVASRRTLSELLGHSERTINRSISYLKEKQVITTSRSGSSVIIHVNSKVAWKNGRAKAKFAKFNATVLISESEQDT